MKRRILPLFVLVLVLAALPVRAAESVLKKGDVVAICGDSITEQKMYTLFIEEYLLMCQPAPELRTCQFGWSGERGPGFVGRMENDVLWLKPTVATTCYGMNDGGYKPMDPATGDTYRKAMLGMVQKFKAAGVRVVVVGSPGAVDTETYRRKPHGQDVYNKTLAALRDIARDVAKEEGMLFGNVFDAMYDTMPKAKAKYGNAYHVCGPDGFHPAPNGHLIMAYAFLKGLGCDGDLGTITVDLAGNKAEATGGHKVLGCQNGAVEIESTRYPFCFFGEPSSPGSTRGIIEFFPFNEDLNRFRLVVTGVEGKAKVTWGTASKEFAGADLAKGINLAAEFLDNPFCQQFQKVEKLMKVKQNFETQLHKKILHDLPAQLKKTPDNKLELEKAASDAILKQKVMHGDVVAEIKPVKHTIKIEVVK